MTDNGAQIKQRRIRAGISLRRLSERAGVSRTTLTAIEDGSSARDFTIGAIEQALSELEQEVSNEREMRRRRDRRQRPSRDTTKGDHVNVDPELSEQADTLYRAVDFLAKTANAGAPHTLIAAHADQVARAARKLWQMCQAVEGEVVGVRVNTTIPEGFQRLHSELFGNHVEGTLPDTIPDDWTEEQ